MTEPVGNCGILEKQIIWSDVVDGSVKRGWDPGWTKL